MKYYLTIDDSVQWFSKLVAQDEPNCISLEAGEWDIGRVHGEFIDNLFNREDNGHIKLIDGCNYRAWSISKKEFNRVKRLIELAPLVEEFQKLSKYE